MRRRLPSALTPSQLAFAHRTIAMLETRTIDSMVVPTFTAQDMVDWLLPKESQRTLREAEALIYYNNLTHGSYHVDLGGYRVRLSVEWEYAKLAMPRTEAFKFNSEAAKPLLDVIAEILRYHQKFNTARRVLEFLNKQTAGAMRAVWPVIVSLVQPEASVHEVSGGERYKNIQNLGENLEAIRDSATTIATALLLPEPPGKKTMFKVAMLCTEYNIVPDVSETFHLV